jgi:EmrB/QacA subfamily drug resistance transporter
MQYKWTVVTVTTVGTLMAGINSRIVIIGLPTISLELHASAVEAVWVTQAYVLASAIFLLLVGRVTDLFGRVKLYNYGFVIFTIGSVLSSIAVDATDLILFRAVQGVGAGILTSNSAALVTDSSPRNELGLMLGINQMATRIGSMLGLTLSGIILSFTDWRGLFYVNIPIGIFGTVWAYMRLHDVSTRDASRKVDWMGFVLFSGGLTLVLVSITFLSYGSSSYLEGFSLLAVGLALLAGFAKTESRTISPLLDLRLFKIRLFAAGNMAQMLNVIAWSGILLLIAFYLQIGIGYSVFLAGIGVIPLELTFLIFSLIGGRLSDKYGSRILCTIGLAVNSSAFAYLSTFGEHTTYEQVLVGLIAIGFGNGMFLAPNMRAIMGSVPPDRRGIASAFRSTVNNVAWTVSYGLVILFMTSGIAYSTLSGLLDGSITRVPGSISNLEFLQGFRIAVLALAIIDAVAILPSIMRGKPQQLRASLEKSGAD